MKCPCREKKSPAPLVTATGQRINDAMEDLTQSNCVVNRPAESLVEAFRFLVRQNDPNRLRNWLAKRPPKEKVFFENNFNGSK
jgi:hypothetical protein